MFKRSEKKIKAVFKMQFRATQVPEIKAKKLMISLMPVDVGKPTVRLAKVPIVDGACTWESPVYETVKLVQEIKTGRIREKFYYAIVSTGSSMAGFLGEVSLDFADLMGAIKPLNLRLPLQTSKSGAILHVTVQRVRRGGPDSRNVDDREAEAPKDGSNCEGMDTDGRERDSYSFDKRNPKSPNSDDFSEASTQHDEENRSLEDVVFDYNDAESGHGAREASNSMSGRLTDQMKMLERKVEHTELEAQSLRKQIVKETKRSQQLSEQIVCLKDERDSLVAECDRLKSSMNEKDAAPAYSQKEIENSGSSLDNIKQELQRHKDLNKKLKSKLQKAEDSNSEFVLAMRDLTRKLDQKRTELSHLSSRTSVSFNEDIDETVTLRQKIDELCSEIEVHTKEKAEVQMDLERLALDYESLELENKDLISKMEQNEKGRMDIHQSYTELLVTERNLKLQVSSLEAENKRKSLQYSESLNMIDELEFQVEQQAQAFTEDLQTLTEAKNEQEQKPEIRKSKTMEESETEDLERQLASVKMEAENLMQENVSMKCQIDLKKTKEENLLFEMKKLRAKNNEVRSLMLQVQLEKEGLEKEVSKLQESLHEQEQNEGTAQQSSITSPQSKTNVKYKTEEVCYSVERDSIQAVPAKQSKQESIPSEHINSVQKSKVASLLERNKSMEEELREMRERYSEISLKFAEVEGERQQLVMALRNMKSGKKN